VKQIRVAILGAGWITEHGYLPHLRVNNSINVVSVYDPDPKKAEKLSRALGLAGAATELSDCLGQATQGVFICAPPHLHLQLLSQCLTSDKYVLCEKPVIRSEEEIESLRSLGNITHRLMGSATTRLRRDVALALSWIHSGRIGNLRCVKLGWWRSRGVPAPGSWRTHPNLSPTGVLEDLGPHLLDILVSVLPHTANIIEESVESILECRYGNSSRSAGWFAAETSRAYNVPDFARAILRFSNGLIAELETCWASEAEGDLSALTFEGSQGEISVQGLFGFSRSCRLSESTCSLAVRGRSVEITHFEIGPEEQLLAFARSIELFAHFCAGAAQPVATSDEVIKAACILNAIRVNAMNEC